MRQSSGARKNLVWGGAILLALAAGQAAVATDYYVATSGADANDGKSPETAWATLGRVSAGPLAPGDRVLFRRGDVWRGQLKPFSGDESAIITYGAFGQGEKPLFLGSLEKNRPEDWVESKPGIWATAEPTPAGPDLVSNPNFDADLSGWSLYVEEGAKATSAHDTAGESGPGGCRIDCAQGGERGSSAQFFTSPFAIEQGQLYCLSYAVRATKSFELEPPTLMQSGPPWTNYATGPRPKPASVGEAWQTHTYYILASAASPNARLTFFLGGGVMPEASSLFVDNVSFVPCTGGHELLPCDVGNIIFENGASCGVKVWNEEDLDQPGEYWYDEARHVLKLVSPQNPAQLHTDIECALRFHIIEQNATHYVTYEDLALMYGAAHGIGGGSTHHISVRDCDFGFIGGGDQMGGDRTVRFGNGVEFWGGAHDCVVERCRLWEIYDAALTNQNNGDNVKEYNIWYRNNLIWNSEYSFEYWNRPENSETHDIYFDNNTCLNAGFGWGHAQRPDPSGRHLCFYSSPAPAKGIHIRNNIFFEAKGNAFYAPAWPKEAVTALDMDNNCWLQSQGVMVQASGKNFPMAEFAAYQAEFKLDAHSKIGEPGILRMPASPTDFGDFHLKSDSPCLDAGTDAGVKEDFDGGARPQGAAPDIGAFEMATTK